MYSSDDYNEGGYESFGDYEPHTGDPQYDLEYDRSYYKMPDMVKKFLVYFRNMINEGMTFEILNLYENTFPKLTEQYFENTPWPDENEVAPIVDKDKVFMILYKELYYRDIYARVPGGPKPEQRFLSFYNYCDLFNYILSAEKPVPLELPDQWLWELIDEFVYQFQSFAQYRSRTSKLSQAEIDELNNENKAWNVLCILNVLHSLVDKSNIKRQLEVYAAGGDPDSVAGEFGRHSLYKMLGYFSLVGLLRLHSLLGDYYQAIKVLENIELHKKSQYSHVPACQISTSYYVGFAYMMMRRYADAIRTLSSALLYIQRTKQLFSQRSYQNDQINKQTDQVMANLNFQQAPRSLASGGVGSRVSSGLVSGVSGHVTPTFGGALSPGRGSTAMPGGAPPSMASRSTLFGQRAFADRRVPMATPMSQANSNSMVTNQSNMANLSRFNASSNYHSVFGEGGDTSTPPLLDLSEFPSLTARGAGDQAPAAAPPPPGSKPYVGMVKQPTSEQSEFTMSSEDFPALPGTSTGGASQPAAHAALAHNPPEYTNHTSDAKPRKGIQTSPDGKVTNIPETMIPNQFGIVGLLTFIRAAESDPSLVSLALGQDLTALGLNLNSPDNLYLTFAGPWADTPCRPQDMDYHVPPEYLINGSIREKLAPLRLSRYKEDLLFYLFYCFVGDVLQIAAAAELYNREWRYHMEEKVWISQAPGMPMVEKTSTYERGTYYFFDAHNWRKVAKEFHLDYSKLEGRPQLPPHVLT